MSQELGENEIQRIEWTTLSDSADKNNNDSGKGT